MSQLRTSIIVVLLLLFSIFIVGCTNLNEKDFGFQKLTNTYITIDINPSIEIITDDEGLVAQVNALNDDAIKLLVDTDFTNQSVDVVLDAILELAIEYGYLDFDLENAILISVATNDDEEVEEVEHKISEKVRDFIESRQMKIEVLKASLAATEDIKALAEEYRISVGKVKIITQALAIESELTFEVAAEMSIRELNNIIKEFREEIREFYSENIRDEYKNARELLKVELQLAVKGLLNQYIQAATDEEFLDLLADSEATVDEVKALYQQYYDALLAVEIPAEEEEDHEEEVEEPLIQEQLENLKKYYDEITKQIQELQKQIRGRAGRDLSVEKFEEILVQIKELMIEQRGIMLQIKELQNPAPNRNKNRFGFEFDFKWDKNQGGPNQHHIIKERKLNDLYEDVEDYYEELFDEIHVDLEDLEEYFMGKIINQIRELARSMKDELEVIRETLKNDSKAIKEQIKEEMEIIKEIWKRR